MSLLEVKHIRAGYGVGPDILTDVTLKIESGQCYSIIGPNGAGKSTLLRVISGLLKPRSGSVAFMGERIDSLRPDQILAKGISFVPQDRSLFPKMTVRENLVMGGFILNDRKMLEQRMEKIFEMFPILYERSAQKARTLSGGEQQMLAIGRALILKPELLMLDEPTLGLAPRIANQIFANIQILRELGKTVLVVEQNARKALKNSDWGFVLDLGRNRFEGPADGILKDPRIQELYLGKYVKS